MNETLPSRKRGWGGRETLRREILRDDKIEDSMPCMMEELSLRISIALFYRNPASSLLCHKPYQKGIAFPCLKAFSCIYIYMQWRKVTVCQQKIIFSLIFFTRPGAIYIEVFRSRLELHNAELRVSDLWGRNLGRYKSSAKTCSHSL